MSETAKTGRKRRAAAGKKMIVIEQYRSGICCNITHKRVLRSLGFRRMWQKVERPDNPAVRGMVETIPHLVRIVEV